MIKLKNTRASTTSCRRSLTVHRLLLQRPVRYYLPREIIFVIAAVHGARVTAPALMDLPVDSRSHGFSQTDMGVEHLNQFTDTHEYPRRVFPSFYKEFLFPIIDFIPVLENPRHLFLLFFSFFFFTRKKKRDKEKGLRDENDRTTKSVSVPFPLFSFPFCYTCNVTRLNNGCIKPVINVLTWPYVCVIEATLCSRV